MISAIAPVIFHEASKGNTVRDGSTASLDPPRDAGPGSLSLMLAFDSRKIAVPPALDPKRRRRATFRVARRRRRGSSQFRALPEATRVL
jgi:hypothetical protein